jgi:hypothetical protein
MSVQSETSRVSYVGNNSTVTPYVVPFYFLNSGDVVIVATTSAGVDTTLVAVTDYALTGEGDEGGGEFTTVAAVPATSTVTVYRDVAATQLTEYEEADTFPAASHERALDKLTMLVQGAIRSVGRCLNFRESDGTTSPIAKAATSLLGFDGSKNPKTYTFQDVYNNLPAPLDITTRPTKVIADAAALAATAPDFTGQIGYRQDTLNLYGATGVSAGNWVILGPGTGSVITAMLATAVLSADATGRGKMASSFFSADATGRGKFATGFVENTLLAAAAINSQTSKATPINADELLIWDSAASALKKCTRLQLFPSGALIDRAYAEYTANTSLTTAIPFDDTIPQVTEGTQILSAAITPKATAHRVRVKFCGFGSGSNSDDITAALFLNGASNAIAASAFTIASTNDTIAMTMEFEHSPASMAAQTYSIRVGSRTGNAVRMNGTTSARKFEGVARSTLVLEEIKA